LAADLLDGFSPGDSLGKATTPNKDAVTGWGAFKHSAKNYCTCTLSAGAYDPSENCYTRNINRTL
jgi:hypothetical protein